MNTFLRKGFLIFLLSALFGFGGYFAVKETARTAANIYCTVGGYNVVPETGVEVEKYPEELVLFPPEVVLNLKKISVETTADVSYSGDMYKLIAGKNIGQQESYAFRGGGEYKGENQRVKYEGDGGVLIIRGLRSYEINPICGYRVIP